MFYLHRRREKSTLVKAIAREVRENIRTALLLSHSSETASVKQIVQGSPFAVQLPTIIFAVVLWTETVNKERVALWKLEAECRPKIDDLDPDWLHDIARYLHNYKANISMMLRKLELVVVEHRWFAEHIGAAHGYSLESAAFRTVADALDSQVYQMGNIASYSSEMVKRTEILIALVSHLISPHLT